MFEMASQTLDCVNQLKVQEVDYILVTFHYISI